MPGYAQVFIESLVNGHCVHTADAHAGEGHGAGLPESRRGSQRPPGGLVSSDCPARPEPRAGARDGPVGSARHRGGLVSCCWRWCTEPHLARPSSRVRGIDRRPVEIPLSTVSRACPPCVRCDARTDPRRLGHAVLGLTGAVRAVEDGSDLCGYGVPVQWTAARRSGRFPTSSVGLKALCFL